MTTFAAWLTLSLLPVQDPFSLPGSFEWGERTVPLVRSDSTTFNAKVYYPSTVEGLDTPIANGGPYPAFTFAHGFAVTADFYDSTLRHLATRGFVVIATQSQVGFNPNRTQYIQDVKDTLTYLEQQNADNGSFLFGRVDTDRFGTSGHSLGGAMSVIVGSQDPRVKAIANLAIAAGSGANSETLNAIAELDVPVSFIYGDLDGITPFATNGIPSFQSAQGPKILPVLEGGYHCGFIDFALPQPLCDVGTVTMEENLSFARAELTSFFELYFQDNQDAWRRVWGPDRLAIDGTAAQLDPGFTLTPAESMMTSTAGGQAIFDITLRNTTDVADAYELFVEDNLWNITFSVDQTPTLAPGEDFTFQAIVSVDDHPSNLLDEALISARSVRDGGTRAYTYVSTAVPEWNSLILSAGLLPILFWVRQSQKRPRAGGGDRRLG